MGAHQGSRVLASLRIVLALLTAAGLAIDAYVHADFAASYDMVSHGGLSQGGLFRFEAAVSALAALLVFVLHRRPWVWALALLVAAAGLAAVLVYRYIDVGVLGPLPDMYEPLWYPEKTASAIAEGAATLTAFLGLAVSLRERRRHGGRSERHGGRSERHAAAE